MKSIPFAPLSLRQARKLIPNAAIAFFLAGAGAGLAAAYGQAPSYGPPPGPPPPPPDPAYYPETAAQPPAADPLDQLMGPVALYPDPLIALLLPASTFPQDINAAAAYLKGGGDPGQADAQPWDPSVRSLAHYPDVVNWMAQNSTWTQSVGAAFAADPASVMNAIQELRALANAAGTLTTTPQQQVVVQPDYIEIEPAQPDVIYVPRYDPAIVFVDQPYYGFNGPYFSFGSPYPAGAWLTFGPNWSGRGIVMVNASYWHGTGGWWHPVGPGPGGIVFSASVNARPWVFPANRPRPQAPSGWQTRAQIVQPRLIAGIPPRPPQGAFRDIHTRGAAAVTVVARDPAAFRGKPIDRALLNHSAPMSPTERARPAAAPLPARAQVQANFPPPEPIRPTPGNQAPENVRPNINAEGARTAPAAGPEERTAEPKRALPEKPGAEKKKPAPKPPAKDAPPPEEKRRDADN
jgi:hypothetical protein